MAEAPETVEGWYALHDLRSIDWAAWKDLPASDRSALVVELASFVDSAQRADDAEEGASAVYHVLGHKGDLLFLHLRPHLEDLLQLERRFDLMGFADFTVRSDSFVSVTELSLYNPGRLRETENPLDNPYVVRRLKPVIPETRFVSFYPMDKRRAGNDNWYSLDMESRRELMRAHGETGRKYAGRVVQLITGAIGFDDWEWGVTLFADDPLVFKKLVYEMRFDEVSARYGEFGPFVVGARLTGEALRSLLDV